MVRDLLDIRISSHAINSELYDASIATIAPEPAQVVIGTNHLTVTRPLIIKASSGIY